MKKYFAIMTVFVAVVLLFSSCKKNDERDPSEVENCLAGEWQGYIQEYSKINGKWVVNDDRHWVVTRFIKGSTPLSGTGNQIEFKTEYMNNTPSDEEKSEFNYKIENGQIIITYKNVHWESVYVNYNDNEVTPSHLKGEWMNFKGDYKFVFDYSKNTNIDWNKYFN